MIPRIDRIDLRDREPAGLSRVSLSGVLPRATLDVAAAAEQIRPVCEDVRQRGAAAVREYTARFDGVDLETVADTLVHPRVHRDDDVTVLVMHVPDGAVAQEGSADHRRAGR